MWSLLRKQAQERSSAAPVATGLKPDTKLYPHQEAAVRKLLHNHGRLIMAAGPGSGKTVTSIAGVEVLRDQGQATRALVVVPAGLRENYAVKGVKRFTNRNYQVIGAERGAVHREKVAPGKDYTIVSYEMFLRDPVGIVRRAGADTLVLDEYHRARDPGGKTYRALATVRPLFRNVIGLTGSIVSNDPVDVVPLVNITTGREYIQPGAFKSRYERRAARVRGFFGGNKYLTTMRRLPELERTLGPLIDYIGTEEIAGAQMPRRDVKYVDVDMSPEQREAYEFALGQAGPVTAWKVRHGLPVSEKEAFHAFGKLMQARRVSNDVSTLRRDVSLEQAAEQTPKTRRLLDDTARHLKRTPDGHAIMYSNLVRGGVDVLAAGLRKRGIPFGVFIGTGRVAGGVESTVEQRQKAVDDYNAGRTRVLLLSGAGAEGLSLPNTTLVQTLDGHFNPERVLQAEARGRRIGGLAHRPQEKRVVQVRRYRSVLPAPGFWGRLTGRKKETSTDEWVYGVATRKAALNQMFRQALVSARLKGLANLPPLPASPAAPPSETQAPARQPKYLRRWKDARGRWRYEYAGRQLI